MPTATLHGHAAALLKGPVVCVTGNNGKTTVKEMVATVLRTRFRVHATRANNNNLVGVPLTIIEAPWDVEALVIEGGGNIPGELPRYREIIEPTITVATNATEGHLEGYGSLEAIVADTVAVTAGVALAVVGMEPRSLAEGARRVAGKVITVGWQDADRVPEVLGSDALARPRVRLAGQEVQLPLPGRHQALNAEFAWAVAPGSRHQRRGGGEGPRDGDGAGGPERTEPGGLAHHPERLLQREPALIRGLDRHGRRTAPRPAAGVRGGHDARTRARRRTTASRRWPHRSWRSIPS